MDDASKSSLPRGRKPAVEESDAEDWGLSDARPGMSLTKKLALALGVAAVAAGGAYGYLHYFPRSEQSAESGSNVAEEGTSSEENPETATLNSGTSAPESDDPFAESSARRGGIAGKSRGEPELMPVPDDEDLKYSLSSGRPQRRTGSTASRGGLVLDLDQDVDEPAGGGKRTPTLAQTEPGEESPELLILDSQTQPRPSGTNSRTAGRSLESDDPARLKDEPKRSTQRAATGKPVTSDDPFESKLDGFEVVEERQTKTAVKLTPPRIDAGGQQIEIPNADEARDERLNGFQIQDDLSERRAVSRTVVTRAPAGASVRSSGTRLTAGFEGSTDALDGAPPAPNSIGSGASSIMPKRSSPPATAAFDAARGFDSRAGSVTGAPGELYTVAPNDNYWTISRKHYGTSKYFMALSRHNETRIPDPHRMRPGMKVETPPAEVLEQRYPELIEKSPRIARKPAIDDDVPHFGSRAEHASVAPGPGPATEEGPAGHFVDSAGIQYYRVGSDDTLTGIAQRHLGRASRWMEVYEINRNVVKNPDSLTIGTVIRLPADASRLGLAPDGASRR